MLILVLASLGLVHTVRHIGTVALELLDEKGCYLVRGVKGLMSDAGLMASFQVFDGESLRSMVFQLSA